MATGQNQRVLRRLGTLLAVGTAGELTDGQLLERFATRTGEAAEQAFVTLVERHGPMVLRVCRGVLFDPNDVEDAFQATFLVLVQKSRSLWVSESLGPWLHQVALRTAPCACSAATRRQRHERIAAVLKWASKAESHNELGYVLHEEIDRLPERFRLTVILCDLEGNTHEQAARHLGWPVGTVKSRLTRARERLRDRLTRRGVAPSAGMVVLLRSGVMEDLLPGALVQATASSAVRFAASRTLLGGSAAILAQGVLTAMSMTRWWKVASLLLVASATVSSAGFLAGKGTTAVASRSQDAGKATAGIMPVAEVKPGKSKLAIVQHGSLEPFKRDVVVVQVEAPTRILSILGEGVKVKKGDLVAELDSAALRDQLMNQRTVAQAALAAYNNAKLSREVAEIAVKEYEEGVYPQDRQSIQGEIKKAELGAQKSESRLERTLTARQRLSAVLSRKDRNSEPADIVAEVDLDDRVDAAQEALSRERLSLEHAKTKLNLLQNYTKEKTIKDLKSEVQRAQNDEIAKQQRWELEKGKEKNLERQIARCTIYAPAEGVVHQAYDPVTKQMVQEGATARERMQIMQIFSTSPMLLNVDVPHSRLAHVTPGAKARIWVDAFPGETYTGVVQEVAQVPAQRNHGRSVYPASVKLDQNPKGLLSGMNGMVAIPYAERDDVIMVPRTAVLHFDFDNKTIVKVKNPNGGFDSREVVLGDLDETATLIEIKQGLKPGEQVAEKPLELLTKEEQNKRGHRQ